MGIGLVIAVFTATFSVVVVAVLVAGQLFENAAARAYRAAATDDELGTTLWKSEELSSISLWAALLNRFDFVEIMRKHLSQADLQWSVGRLTLSMLLSGALAFAVFLRLNWLPFWAAIGGTWLISLGPYMYVLRRRRRRFNALTADLPDALDSLSRGMKAGYPITAALEIVSREIGSPLSSEFHKTSVEVNLGVPLRDALQNLTERVPIIEMELFSAAVQLHARTGGRLTDVLTALAENIREDTALQGEIRSMSAQGRVTGLILTVLPLAIGAMMAAVSPSYIGLLLGHPYGKHMIAASLFCLIAAHFVMRRIVDVRL